ncbi:MAG: hypothetical protein LYZ66_04120 [Nitrososphaerales archaeon]|nr:hypothetical protein [Nitrososphaerales archaeon]
MDISRQVFVRSARMGLSYVVLSLVMAVFLTVSFGIAGRAGNIVASNGQVLDFGSTLSYIVVPFAAIFGLLITTPTYLLFVNDKNTGVLEYLLAVGMSQRDVFKGYLKAALMLSLVAILPALAINAALSSSGIVGAGLAGGLALVTGLADVSMVTFLMTAFGSMQRKPTGMNSPVGITIGIVIVMPELLLQFVLGAAIVWLDLAIALAVLVTAAVLLSSVDKLIMREKLLP